MSEQRVYPPGVPCWVDTEQPDLDAARQFYGGLFGWTLTDAVPADAPGSYLIATQDGADVAALAPAASAPATWNTYVAVANADTTARAVVAAGGRLIAAPEDAGPGGRSAVCADPGGAEFRLWQPRRRLGAQLVNSPGAWNFSDLFTADRAGATAFYASVFGWRAADLGQGAGTMLQVPGYGDHLAATIDPTIYERQAAAPPGFADVIAGLVETAADTEACWRVTFTVADRDATAARAEQLGAQILSTAESQWNKRARVRDPQGAEFDVSQFTPPENW